MTYYYWNPAGSGQQPYTSFPQFPFSTQTQQTQQIPPATTGGAMTPSGTSFLPRQEESYIENILRLNRGKEAVFSFTIPSSLGTNNNNGSNTILVRGVVVEAGRDHAVIRENQTDHYFLFPMVYFDYARFEEPVNYLRGGAVTSSMPRQ